MAAGIDATYEETPPVDGPSICYGASFPVAPVNPRCLHIAHRPEAWAFFDGPDDVHRCELQGDLPLVFPAVEESHAPSSGIGFDLVANSFYFLSSWSERRTGSERANRRLYATATFARLGISQTIVDRYLEFLLGKLNEVDPSGRAARTASLPWPGQSSFAIALTHDVDFLPSGLADNLRQGAKTFARHLIRQRSPGDALRAGAGLLKSLARGRDPHGCVPEIIAAETSLGVRSSFQIAVARRHPADVNYDVDEDRTRDYLRAITDAGFDLCLHGSYRSTENPEWYRAEVEKLARRIARPCGSRQHYLSFAYDALFGAQEASGIQFDMSMGFPDYHGPRAGFSFPYFPFDLTRDRPFDVVEIGLVLMDATLRGYMNLAPARARVVIDSTLQALRDRRGAASVVWHPIVFGGARDPGYDDLYWELIGKVKELGGWATDGRSINDAWRARARRYASFAWA